MAAMSHSYGTRQPWARLQTHTNSMCAPQLPHNFEMMMDLMGIISYLSLETHSNRWSHVLYCRCQGDIEFCIWNGEWPLQCLSSFATSHVQGTFEFQSISKLVRTAWLNKQHHHLIDGKPLFGLSDECCGCIGIIVYIISMEISMGIPWEFHGIYARRLSLVRKISMHDLVREINTQRCSGYIRMYVCP